MPFSTNLAEVPDMIDRDLEVKCADLFRRRAITGAMIQSMLALSWPTGPGPTTKVKTEHNSIDVA